MKDQGAHRLSRRTILIGLAGLAGVTAAGGAIAWLKLAGSTSAQSNHPQPTAPQGVIVTTPLLTYRGHHAPVTAVAWHDTRIASGGGDHTVQVWNANTGAPLLTYSGHTDIVTALSWSPDGRKIVVGAAHTGFIQVWDASTGATLLTYRGHQQKTGDTSITDVAWSPNGQWIASSSLDDSVQIWDSATGAALLTYRTDPPAAMGTAEWSPDSTRIAASGMAGAVHIFAASTGTTLGVLPGNGSPTIASQWSPDGTRIATCDETGAFVWDVSTRKPSVRYHGHGRFTVPDIARSPDGRYIASDALDVQMWEAATGRLRLTYRPGASAEFFQIALAPDGTRLAVGSSDMTVQVFQGL